MKSTVLSGGIAVLLSGCAALAVDECTADPYQLGRRDGRIGAHSQAESYSARCAGRARFDVDRYLEGWRDGVADRPRPVAQAKGQAAARLPGARTDALATAPFWR